MKLALGFSPCPNDTFIFDALVNKKIDTEGLDFDVMLEDVETLNRWALETKLDVTKLSFPAFFQCDQKYALLNSGAALGQGVGPLLISKAPHGLDDVNDLTIALPGIYTTANLLFSFAFPGAHKKKFMIFSAIEDAVLNNETDLGVIIHENRFTYEQKGLLKIVDLGEFWEEKMKAPVPLGAIAIRRTFEQPLAATVTRLIRKSVQYAYAHYPQLADYVKDHSGQLSEDVMRRHIDLYVNSYSLDLGIEGNRAIETLYAVFRELAQTATNPENSLFG